MNSAQKCAALAAAIVAAAAAAVPFTAPREGMVTTGYHDVGRPKNSNLDAGCYGHTIPGGYGKKFTPTQCIRWLAEDEVKAGLDIATCLPEELPLDVRTAFTDAAFNLGSATFCKSSMSKKALAGDLRGACASLSLYIYAGGKILPGLVKRRADERALCELGLIPHAPGV